MSSRSRLRKGWSWSTPGPFSIKPRPLRWCGSSRPTASTPQSTHTVTSTMRAGCPRAAPNAGNPQKAQRYAREWADALRIMAKSGAEVLRPGHGVPVFGLTRVRQMMLDTAEYLQGLYDQTVAMMNQGARLDQIVETVA